MSTRLINFNLTIHHTLPQILLFTPKMKLLVILSLFALSAASQEPEEQIREKRGLFAAPIPISYSSHYTYHSPPVAVAYHAPLPAVKVIQPLPVAKIVTPAISYTKLAYPSILPYYGYSHGYAHAYGHGFGHFH